jgi:hypothetical protein
VAANIDVKELEKIVFKGVTPLKSGNSGKLYSVTGAQQTEYVEEESYVNPPNVDYSSELDIEDQKVRSLNDIRQFAKIRVADSHDGKICGIDESLAR